MKNIIAYSFILFFAGISLVSCLGDLDTMPLDDNQLVSEKVYQTKDGYTGVLAKCYASLILTGQQGGDGGDGDLEGANEGYSGYVRLLFYLQELSTDNFLMPSSSNGLRKCLNLQWDASNASVITWTYQRLYMSIAYCNELLRECTEGKLQSRGLWEEMKDDYVSYRAEARFIRAYCYSMLCDLFGAVPYVDGLIIEKGVLKIDLNYWYSCGSWYTNHNTYIFRYQNNQFEMIGYESSEFHRASGEATSISINYSTKKKIETTGLNEFNESKTKSKVSKIKINKLYNLNEIVMDYNFPNE
jgi:hypothetical protein